MRARAHGIVACLCVLACRAPVQVPVTGEEPPGGPAATPGPAAPPVLQASPSSVAAGGSVTLTPIFEGGTGVIAPGIGPVTSGVPVSTGPLCGPIAFTLTVTSADGAQSRATAQLEVQRQAPRATGSLKFARSFHAAALLANGAVLVAGGVGGTGTPNQTAELYDPVEGSFRLTGPLAHGRYQHTATALADGTVLIAGGRNNSGGQLGAPVAEAELYDPATGAFRTVGSLHVPRSMHAAVALQDGTVLIAGGFADEGYGCCEWGRTAEIFDPRTGQFTVAGRARLGREGPTLSLLPGGKALLAGGFSGNFYRTLELYDPAARAFSQSAASLQTARAFHTATTLPDGRVLLAGGQSDPFDTSSGTTTPTASVELYDPAADATFPLAPLTAARSGHTATLSGGDVLIAGGSSADFSQFGALDTAESIAGSSLTATAAARLGAARKSHTATALRGCDVLVAGGRDANNGNLASAELR